uniref:Ig-like domain-containing protein n=1 Tax=Labrus bergylta TaxID=56723 RepID=A0A3Q3EX63_9LABR
LAWTQFVTLFLLTLTGRSLRITELYSLKKMILNEKHFFVPTGNHIKTVSVIVPSGVICDDLTPVKNEVFGSEDSTITLSYRYSKTVSSGDNFFWYRQHPGKPPEFILYISGRNSSRPAESLKSDSEFSTKVSGKNHLDLQISSAALTDSAVYYCAVRGFSRKTVRFWISMP